MLTCSPPALKNADRTSLAGALSPPRAVEYGNRTCHSPRIAAILPGLSAACAEQGETAVSDASQEKIPRIDLVITATRQETPKEDVAADIEVITRQQIEGIPATTAAEVLQHVPGVYIDFSGGPGSSSSASIQGSDTRQVAVYQDGVPLNQLANPFTNLSQLPVEAIERIEVYKGAASSAWGSALGGVINIITREPDPTKPLAADLQSTYGSFETFKERGTVSGTVDRLGYLLSVTHDQSDGFRPYTGYDQTSVYGKLNYGVGESGRLNFVYSDDEGYNQDPAIGLPFWDEYYTHRDYQRLLFETPLSDALTLNLEGRRHGYEATRDMVYPLRKLGSFDYTEQSYGSSARLGHVWENNRFNLGFDADWGNYDYTDDTGYTARYPSEDYAVYANDTYNLGRLTFTGGIRYDDNSDFGSEISPSGGMVIRLPWQNALVRAQIARGFNAPPALWVNDPRYGNKDLEAETGLNYQVGGEVHPLGLMKLGLNLFRSDIDNYLRFNPEIYKFENIDSVTRQGLEATAAIPFQWGLTLAFGATFVDVRDNLTDTTVPDVPQILYDTSAHYTYKWMTHSLVGRYVDSNPSDPEARDRVFIFDYQFTGRLPLPKPYGTASIYAAAYNLTNTHYQYFSYSPKAGRWFEGGLRYEF